MLLLLLLVAVVVVLDCLFFSFLQLCILWRRDGDWLRGNLLYVIAMVLSYGLAFLGWYAAASADQFGLSFCQLLVAWRSGSSSGLLLCRQGVAGKRSSYSHFYAEKKNGSTRTRKIRVELLHSKCPHEEASRNKMKDLLHYKDETGNECFPCHSPSV